MTKLGKIILGVGVLLLGVIIFFKFIWWRLEQRPTPAAPRPEIAVTIIPGWNLRQIADYLVLKGLATSTEAVYAITGEPAAVVRGSVRQINFFWVPNEGAGGIWLLRPPELSVEGYLAPETIRVYADASLTDVIKKFLLARDAEIGPESALPSTGPEARSWHEILTMASIVEKEVKHDEDRALVADILWRRLQKHWALQVDSSVHYAIDKTGDVFTSDTERNVNSPWNTYRYPGLPPGPICNPSVASIKAALSPEKNEYWYFLSGKDGKIYYAKTLEDHNRNKKYL